MARLTRSQTQERNRTKVLEAAKEEFAERGFREAKIDTIAERAELTRGAVYSNFPGKRALYFAVLADLAKRAPLASQRETRLTPREALGAFARAWVARLPLTTDDPMAPERLGVDLLPEVLADERVRRPFGQLTKLSALLLGLALEGLHPRRTRAGRQVRVAEAVLTTLHGTSQLAAAAPGFIEPFNVIGACEQLASLEVEDVWQPPHLPYVPQARPADRAWTPPSTVDIMTGDPVRLADDGVIAVLGMHRLSAAEEAVRAAPDLPLTMIMVTSTPAELAPLARLVLAELRACLFLAFPTSALPMLRMVSDETGALAAAAGVPAVSDATEVAVRVVNGKIVARAEGFGACHAAASAR
ncbi:TetR family transcriptional regulator [Herbihabitans rhizosphaerae]|uniref:TetR family transcriptional regulator n=1 Tax=Herbihabitans rhizosphaerae TaxID=1872711 RepID=A0A4Q7KYI9_9PSEU|nr:TetR/AcrR family transcriptional regulator [Herbihabitans rhizosphaerae]RZS40742.1 TetR family transcriptional regulator [Herbihabitans rhizosphaerae]